MSNQPAVLGPDGVKRPYIGGQALLEGVMMRSPHAYSAVVRRRDQSLVVREAPMPDLRKGRNAWPLVRGVVALVESLKLGHRTLQFSIGILEQDLEAEEREKAQAAKDSAAKSKLSSISTLVTAFGISLMHLLTSEPDLPSPSPSPQAEDKGRAGLGILSVLLPLALYVALPQAIAEGVSSLFKLHLDVRSPMFQLITATAKVSILMGMMMLLRQSSDMYRWLQYHGAEHKSIHTYEKGLPLTVENARKQTTLHPRCGTTFIVMVALVSVAVFSCLGPFLPQLGLGKLGDNVLFFVMKLPFLPFIVALTFELQRLFARYCSTGPLRVLLWPGFLVQKITTIEPDDHQLEVALSALLVTLKVETGKATAVEADSAFPTFETLAEPLKGA